MLKKTFHCAEDGCPAAEAFTIRVPSIGNEDDDNVTMRLLAVSCGWRIDQLEDEHWCPEHRLGELSGV